MLRHLFLHYDGQTAVFQLLPDIARYAVWFPVRIGPAYPLRVVKGDKKRLVAGRASGCKMLPNLWMMRTSKSNTHTRASSADDAAV